MAKPSDTLNPAAYSDLAVAIEEYVGRTLMGLQVCVPVIVTEDFNPETNKVKVRPIVKAAYHMDDNTVEYEDEKEFNVYVKHWGIGNAVLVFPVKKGMTGWVIASDKDTYNSRKENSNIAVENNTGASKPASTDGGSYGQGYFIADRWLPSISAGAEDPYFEAFGDDKDACGIRLIDKKLGVFFGSDGSISIEQNDGDGIKKVQITLDDVQPDDDVKLRETWIVEAPSSGTLTFKKVLALRSDKAMEIRNVRVG